MYKNEITLTGTIRNLPEFVKYIPAPMTAFDLEVFRKKSPKEEAAKMDLVRLVVFNDEGFNKKFKDGDRIKVTGEIQSRNYTIDNYEVNVLLENAIRSYIELFEEFPCQEKPAGKTREIIDWKFIMDAGLIPEVPKDSLYLENGKKAVKKPGEEKYVYRMDEDMVIYKEMQHVAIEVLVISYELIADELNPNKGDLNNVTVLGEVTWKNSTPKPSGLTVTQFKVKTDGRVFNNRFYHINVVIWENSKSGIASRLQVNDTIRVTGRLQSREYEKEIRIQTFTRTGAKKVKKIMKTNITREVHSKSIEKITAAERELV